MASWVRFALDGAAQRALGARARLSAAERDLVASHELAAAVAVRLSRPMGVGGGASWAFYNVDATEAALAALVDAVVWHVEGAAIDRFPRPNALWIHTDADTQRRVLYIGRAESERP